MDLKGIFSIATSSGLKKEEALMIYGEERKHEREARCAVREHACEAEERTSRRAAREKKNLELRI